MCCARTEGGVHQGTSLDNSAAVSFNLASPPPYLEQMGAQKGTFGEQVALPRRHLVPEMHTCLLAGLSAHCICRGSNGFCFQALNYEAGLCTLEHSCCRCFSNCFAVVLFVDRFVLAHSSGTDRSREHPEGGSLLGRVLSDTKRYRTCLCLCVGIFLKVLVWPLSFQTDTGRFQHLPL